MLPDCRWDHCVRRAADAGRGDGAAAGNWRTTQSHLAASLPASASPCRRSGSCNSQITWNALEINQIPRVISLISCDEMIQLVFPVGVTHRHTDTPTHWHTDTHTLLSWTDSWALFFYCEHLPWWQWIEGVHITGGVHKRLFQFNQK